VDRALPIDRQIAKWSAVSVVFIAVTYVLTGVVWMVSGGLSAPAPLEPAQPFLSILEFLIILTAPPLVILVAALHRCAAEEQNTRTLAALGFMIAFATLTTAGDATSTCGAVGRPEGAPALPMAIRVTGARFPRLGCVSGAGTPLGGNKLPGRRQNGADRAQKHAADRRALPHRLFGTDSRCTSASIHRDYGLCLFAASYMRLDRQAFSPAEIVSTRVIAVGSLQLVA